MISQNLFHQPNYGYLKFSNTANNRNVIFRSYYYHTNDNMSEPLKEDNYAHLINFLNYDVSALNDNIHSVLLSILDDDEIDNIRTRIESIGTALIEWHPFLTYNLLYTICDLMIAYALEFIPRTYNSTLLSASTEELIKIICTKITSPFNITNTEFIDYFLELYRFSDARKHYTQKTFRSPLGDLEYFREFIANTMPNILFSSNPSIWIDFYNIAHLHYGDYITVNTSYDAANFIIPQVNLSVTPEQHHPIESFPHYIVTQLESFRETEGCIAFCNDCGCFYLKNSTFPDHPCLTNEYFEQMNSRNKTIYRRIYRRALNKLHHEYSDCTLTPIDYLHNSGFMKFHTNTFRYAIRHNISLEMYTQYTDEEKYDYNNYHLLPPLSQYATS